MVWQMQCDEGKPLDSRRLGGLPLGLGGRPLDAGLFSNVDAAITNREAWSMNLSAELTTFLDQPGRTFHPRVHQKEHDPALRWDHARYDMLGPIAPRCKRLEVYGRGDDEKRACGLQALRSPCRIISIGSANNWGFERAVARRTCCRIDTFDCTIARDVEPPTTLRGRVFLHHACLGVRNETRGASHTRFSGVARERQFFDWPSLLRSIQLSTPPDFLKMDIEGFEYETLRSMLATEANAALLPRQIAVELHYKTQFRELSWFGRYLGAGEIALFMDHLWRRGGFLLVDRNDNRFCPHCTELLLARFDRPSSCDALPCSQDSKI